MNVIELFNLGNKYHSEGKVELAVNLWNDCVNQDRVFSLPLINLANTYKQMNNLVKARECFLEFIRRPLTGETIDLLPKVREEINQINAQLNPKPVETK